MKKILIAAVVFMMAVGASAQVKVKREGNVFTQVQTKDTTTVSETKTDYTYVDSKGNRYTVFLSKTGKAFIWRTSSKTGKKYPQYLPEIGKQINPKAYQK